MTGAAQAESGSRKPLRLLFISNGHGEDAIGARLAASILRFWSGGSPLGELKMTAFPLVGLGGAYLKAGVPVVGPCRELPSAGLTLHHPSLLWRDLRAGVVGLTLAQASFLRGFAADAVLVVGDAFAQALAALVRAPRSVYQPLVSVRQTEGRIRTPLNRLFMERIRAPELLLMRRAARVYARDEATAAWLRQAGVDDAVHLGNPMMDGLEAQPLPMPAGARAVALLPGSRPYAHRSIKTMLAALELAAQARGQRETRSGTQSGAQPEAPRLVGLAAWALGEPPPAPRGWTVQANQGRSLAGGGELAAVWRKGAAEVWWLKEAFATVLASAEAAFGTAGTANEQAAGLGLPVTAFAVPPDYGHAFLDGQRRLLGGALRVVGQAVGFGYGSGDSATEPGLLAELAEAVTQALTDGSHLAAARTSGPERMGGPGGTNKIAADIAVWLAELSAARR